MFYNQFQDLESTHSVLIEDDGKVAYAYLLVGEKIDSDVWLYNIGESPIVPGWKTSHNAPYKNAHDYIEAIEFKPVESNNEINIVWVRHEGQIVANVYLRNKLHAVLKAGVKPGWCILAKSDGPLAKRLTPGVV